MPATEAIRKDAELVVDVCMSVEADDVVTIITDDEHQDEAHVVAEVCVDRGAWPVIMNNEMQVRRGRADTHFPMIPPRNLHEAMVSSDEIIIITNLEWANRFAHVPAVKASCENNAKIASVEPGMGSWGLTVEKLHLAQQRALDAMAALEGVEQLRHKIGGAKPGDPSIDLRLIAATTTAKGLRVTGRLDRRRYPTGKKVSDEAFATLSLTPDRFHGEWNYSIYPRSHRV